MKVRSCPWGWAVVVDKVLVVMLDVLKGLQHLNEVVDFIDVSDFELLSLSEEEGKHNAFMVELHEGLLSVEGDFSNLVQGRLLSLKQPQDQAPGVLGEKLLEGSN